MCAVLLRSIRVVNVGARDPPGLLQCRATKCQRRTSESITHAVSSGSGFTALHVKVNVSIYASMAYIGSRKGEWTKL